MKDHVLFLITQYQEIERAYNRHPEADKDGLEILRLAHIDSMELIRDSDQVATSMNGALAALRQALAEERETQVGARSVTIALMEMALGYFETIPSQEVQP